MSSIREVLRALAEVRDGDFYPLWIDVMRQVHKPPLPQIGFRIYQVADSSDAMVTVWVGATRSDGNDVNWGVSVQTDGDTLLVTGEISVGDDLGSCKIFSLSDRSTDAARTAELVRHFAQEICARRECLETTEAGGASA